jgi:hypothetical protein
LGVLSGKDLFSPKWITAEITDSSSRIWYVPIKSVLGDYFLAEIDKQVYCFKIDGQRIKTYRHTLVKSFRILQYDTSHYKPLSAGDNKLLEETIKKNHLPKMDYRLHGILKIASKHETDDFSPIALKHVVDKVSEKQEQYPDQAQNLLVYIQHLQADQIVTPIKYVSEFLDGELMTTDPKFLGDIVSALQRTDMEHKKITNTPITGKVAWMKIIAIVAIIGLVCVIGYVVYAGGYLNHLPGLSLVPPQTSSSIMTKYPTPETLKCAIAKGDIKYTDLPSDVQKMVDSAKAAVTC